MHEKEKRIVSDKKYMVKLYNELNTSKYPRAISGFTFKKFIPFFRVKCYAHLIIEYNFIFSITNLTFSNIHSEKGYLIT